MRPWSAKSCCLHVTNFGGGVHDVARIMFCCISLGFAMTEKVGKTMCLNKIPDDNEVYIWFMYIVIFHAIR